MHKSFLTTCLFAALISTALNAHAGSESGVYLGGSFGNAELDYDDSFPDFGEIDIDDDDTGYKLFAGYNFGVVPLLDLAIEGGYIDFGSQSDMGARIDVTGWNLSGLAGINLGPIGLFGKAGVIDWESDIENLSFDRSESGTDPAYGVGAKFHLWSISVRAEYEIFEANRADINFYSIGAAVTF